jgi:hypothetical protein
VSSVRGVRSKPSEVLIPIPQPARLLNESEVKAAFAAITADHELWLAINQLLQGYINDVTQLVARSANATQHGELAHAAGGLAWLGYLQAELEQRFEETHLLA